VRNNLLSWWGNVLGVGKSFPMFSAGRLIIFYLLAALVWIGYFFGIKKIAGKTEE